MEMCGRLHYLTDLNSLLPIVLWGWVGPIADLDAVEKKKISYPR
jgi:hypothetical protein